MTPSDAPRCADEDPDAPPAVKSSGDGAVKRINLALQGGGSHGALAWGVLDRLLEDERIEIDGVAATSAGSMNAAMLAQGLVENGRDGARAKLDEFWRRISDAGRLYSPIKRSAYEKMFGDWNMDESPAFFWFDAFTKAVSPYKYNPLGFNPLRDVIEDLVDFDKVRSCGRVKLFICATNVHTGKVRVFRTDEVSADVVMASACLPHLFHAVQIGDEYFWDGGYSGNPALFPLFYHVDAQDILIVHINPIERPEVPVEAADIHNRINEITFNSSLLKEMRAIDFVNRLIEDDMIKDEHKHRFRKMLVHSIRSDLSMRGLSVASKFDSDWEFLCYLRDLGRRSAGQWLARNFKHLNMCSTVDLRTEFLGLGSRHIG